MRLLMETRWSAAGAGRWARGWGCAARVAAWVSPLVMIACADTAGTVRAPEIPSDQQARSRVRPDPLEPLVIEWPASERAELEARLGSGLVVVRYDGRTMDVLRQCRMAGGYEFHTTSVHRDLIVIEDERELQARLPLGAARLSATLRQAGQLQVRLAVVGTYRAAPREFLRSELEGDCDGASHVVNSVAVGAFELKSGGLSQVQGGASIANVGAGAEHGSRTETLSSSGEVAACERLTGEHAAPPEGCGALVRLGLATIRRDPPVAPPPLPQEPPADAGSPAAIASSSPASSSSAPTPIIGASREPPAASIPMDEPAPLRNGEADRSPYRAEQSSGATTTPSHTSAWVYVGAGTVLALVVGLAVLAAALKKDEPEPQPAPTGGLGNTSLPLGVSW